MDGRARSVAVVASDEWLRRGLTHALTEHGAVVKTSVVHDDAHADGALVGVDAVIVEALGARDRWDRVSGVGVVEEVVRHDPSPVVVALLPDDPSGLIARRMAEAGVTRAVHRKALAGVGDLLRALAHPVVSEAATSMFVQACSARLGITARSRINAGVEHIVENGLEAHFTVDTPRLTRRQLITLRSHLNAVMRLDPVSSGSSAVVERTMPSWRQLRTVVDGARGAQFGPPSA